MRMPFRFQRASDAVDARGKIEHAPGVLLHVLQRVQRLLNGEGIVGDAVPLCAVIRLHVFPTGERPGKFLAGLIIAHRLCAGQGAQQHYGQDGRQQPGDDMSQRSDFVSPLDDGRWFIIS